MQSTARNCSLNTLFFIQDYLQNHIHVLISAHTFSIIAILLQVGICRDHVDFIILTIYRQKTNRKPVFYGKTFAHRNDFMGCLHCINNAQCVFDCAMGRDNSSPKNCTCPLRETELFPVSGSPSEISEEALRTQISARIITHL